MSLRFLIVDDTRFMRLMLTDILRKLDYEVVGEADNGEKAVALYRELKPDVVFMDISMPGMDGVEALRQIRRMDPKSVVIICSAVSQQDLIDGAVKEGASGYVMKPFKPKQIREVIEKVKPAGAVAEPKSPLSGFGADWMNLMQVLRGRKDHQREAERSDAAEERFAPAPAAFERRTSIALAEEVPGAEPLAGPAVHAETTERGAMNEQPLSARFGLSALNPANPGPVASDAVERTGVETASAGRVARYGFMAGASEESGLSGGSGAEAEALEVPAPNVTDSEETPRIRPHPSEFGQGIGPELAVAESADPVLSSPFTEKSEQEEGSGPVAAVSGLQDQPEEPAVAIGQAEEGLAGSGQGEGRPDEIGQGEEPLSEIGREAERPFEIGRAEEPRGGFGQAEERDAEAGRAEPSASVREVPEAWESPASVRSDADPTECREQEPRPVVRPASDGHSLQEAVGGAIAATVPVARKSFERISACRWSEDIGGGETEFRVWLPSDSSVLEILCEGELNGRIRMSVDALSRLARWAEEEYSRSGFAVAEPSPR